MKISPYKNKMKKILPKKSKRIIRANHASQTKPTKLSISYVRVRRWSITQWSRVILKLTLYQKLDYRKAFQAIITTLVSGIEQMIFKVDLAWPWVVKSPGLELNMKINSKWLKQYIKRGYPTNLKRLNLRKKRKV